VSGAIFAYNRADWYVRKVLDQAQAYRAAAPSAGGWVVPVHGRCSSGFGFRGGEFHAGQAPRRRHRQNYRSAQQQTPQAGSWVVPARGKCSSGFGPREGEFHAGQDMARSFALLCADRGCPLRRQRCGGEPLDQPHGQRRGRAGVGDGGAATGPRTSSSGDHRRDRNITDDRPATISYIWLGVLIPRRPSPTASTRAVAAQSARRLARTSSSARSTGQRS
jgi:hypothetical protein